MEKIKSKQWAKEVMRRRKYREGSIYPLQKIKVAEITGLAWMLRCYLGGLLIILIALQVGHFVIPTWHVHDLWIYGLNLDASRPWGTGVYPVCVERGESHCVPCLLLPRKVSLSQSWCKAAQAGHYLRRLLLSCTQSLKSNSTKTNSWSC